jgi:hypothetical protein
VNFASLPGLAVLNPGGRDPDQSFATDSDRTPQEAGPDAHAPVNYHGYAACSFGGFYRTIELAARHRNIVLLLRRNLKKASRALGFLKSRGCCVAMAFKESGAFQVASTLARPGNFRRFQEIAAESDLCLSSTPDLVPLYAAVHRNVAYVPTPYPVDLDSWDFARKVNERRGIFVGTRELDVASRHHLVLLASLRTMPYPITVVDPEPRRIAQRLRALGFPLDQVRIVAPLPYLDYLRLIAEHRIILQFDTSLVPGQVAGDGLLCRLPTVGGNGAIERLVCPSLNGHGRDFGELLDLARRLMIDQNFYCDQVAALENKSQELISFQAIRSRLAALFPGLCD